MSMTLKFYTFDKRRNSTKVPAVTDPAEDISAVMKSIIEDYSPEMINNTGYNKCIDFWQFGVLIYEMMTGYPPFSDSNPINLFKMINK